MVTDWELSNPAGAGVAGKLVGEIRRLRAFEEAITTMAKKLHMVDKPLIIDPSKVVSEYTKMVKSEEYDRVWDLVEESLRVAKDESGDED